MSTAEAIAALRNKIEASQEEFAKRLGITVTSVSRYENGREPSRAILKKLADLAEFLGVDYIADIFVAKLRGDIFSQVERLPSPGSARRVPVRELSQWLGELEVLYEAYGTVNLRDDIPAAAKPILRLLRNQIRLLFNNIHVYVESPGPVSSFDLSLLAREGSLHRAARRASRLVRNHDSGEDSAKGQGQETE